MYGIVLIQEGERGVVLVKAPGTEESIVLNPGHLISRMPRIQGLAGHIQKFCTFLPPDLGASNYRWQEIPETPKQSLIRFPMNRKYSNYLFDSASYVAEG